MRTVGANLPSENCSPSSNHQPPGGPRRCSAEQPMWEPQGGCPLQAWICCQALHCGCNELCGAPGVVLGGHSKAVALRCQIKVDEAIIAGRGRAWLPDALTDNRKCSCRPDHEVDSLAPKEMSSPQRP